MPDLIETIKRRWAVRKDDDGVWYTIARSGWLVMPDTRREFRCWAHAMGHANLMTWVDRGRPEHAR
jgi:hypothetical protein